MKPFVNKPSYNELVQRLIQAETLEDFLRIKAIFVPNRNVKAWVKQKNKQLEVLTAKCAWDKQEFQLTSEEQNARERFQKIMALMSEYEQRFCL